MVHVEADICICWFMWPPIIDSNPIIFISLQNSEDYYKRLGSGSMCAKGMGCEKSCVRWVRGTGAATGHPGLP